MNRTVIRISSAALAAVATLSVLKAIAELAAVAPTGQMPLVVLPRVEVVATVPQDAPIGLADAQPDARPR